MAKRREPVSTYAEAERVFLVGIMTGDMKRREAEASLEELRRLAESTTGTVVGSTLVHIRNPSPATFFSEGLTEMLTGEIAATTASTVILDDDVSPVQQRNLDTRWAMTVLNRSELILDVFARRARTSDGKLQVELAQYQYRLPRLRGYGAALSRQGGGIGARGPGEMKLETDRRAIEQRVDLLEKSIAKMKRQRQTQRNRRQISQAPVVALVGYTNAGKSTLMNALTGADAMVEDKLFATLDPLTRRGKLTSGMEVAFIDTVGFINRLPTQLAAAFRATLEEVQYADVLLHVVDASSPNYEEEIKVTEGVLKDLGAGATPTITVWNKIDKVEGVEPGFFAQRRKPSVAVSALNGDGMPSLLGTLEDLINAARPQVWLRIDYKDYGAVHEIESAATVHKMLHRNEGIFILASLSPGLLGKYAKRLHPEGPPPVEG